MNVWKYRRRRNPGMVHRRPSSYGTIPMNRLGLILALYGMWGIERLTAFDVASAVFYLICIVIIGAGSWLFIQA